MGDVTLVLLPREYVQYAAKNARWLLFLAPLLCTLLETVLPLPFLLSTLLELCCALIGGFVRHHAPDLDRILRPPYSLFGLGVNCLFCALLGVVSRPTVTLMVYGSFTLLGYTYVATTQNRTEQVASYKAYNARSESSQ